MKRDLFSGYDGVGNILFVNTKKEIDILPAEKETTIRNGEEQKETSDNITGAIENNTSQKNDESNQV
ncbi:hypothetical protein PITCH_A1380031 [uncultured Desulfobacterium sp.]|uniref:Uncharacterized protein n=1 Tax=uncultured Desulfobacterium sp. TaxID=201089 RepID=A0A445MSR4_9BACT|nr:hypothetical protein PITCH_A1380031 [uncultured Desulfobacterium sp.]